MDLGPQPSNLDPQSLMRFNLFNKPTALAGYRLSHKEAKRLILHCKDAAKLHVSVHLNLSNNPTLEALPEGLTAASLDVSGCESLGSLPNNLRVGRLNLSACKSLTALPPGLSCYELEMRETE